VGAVTLVLGGLAVHPAAAQTRQQAVNQANDYSLDCLNQGGEPDAEVLDSGSIDIECTFDDGSTETCIWNAFDDYNQHCSVIHGVTRPPVTHLPVDGGGVLDNGGMEPGGTDALTSGLTGPDGHQQPAATPPPSHGKAKQHRHGHHGKRH
jgi:hypothetical protein